MHVFLVTLCESLCIGALVVQIFRTTKTLKLKATQRITLVVTSSASTVIFE